jgi:hypothetical protein
MRPRPRATRAAVWRAFRPARALRQPAPCWRCARAPPGRTTGSDPTLLPLFQPPPGAGFVVNGARPARSCASAGAELRYKTGWSLGPTASSLNIRPTPAQRRRATPGEASHDFVGKQPWASSRIWRAKACNLVPCWNADAAPLPTLASHRVTRAERGRHHVIFGTLC